ncbi:hypothetical protein [Marinicella rhabdoformis]|uniref:hypothetical protein n=1 Tax=Marinicella rhabdoformis TaxID=2580566 RepID=UPI0012AED6B4|nr:hypothetical protein [Marinicella rhabdoformis]
MNTNNHKSANNTSTKHLLISIFAALLLATIIYLIAILPAEFNQDPTGLGEKLGLTVLSATQDTVEPTPIQAQADQGIDEAGLRQRIDEVTVNVPAGRGIEYKLFLEQHDSFKYEWKTLNDEDIYFDLHGEPVGDTTGFFESYSIATTTNMEGTTTVPFTGSHGWYWKNTTDEPIRISLKTSGQYEVIGLK